ncbi:MAG: THUMP domain-containing protein [Bacteroidetes bacterium]|nr:THUMP domain-containing protein [Bacteroidota bacterium]
MEKFKIVVKTFAGLEPVLAMELKALGAEGVTPERRAVSFLGDKELLYKANFLLRTALKVLKPIAQFKVNKKEDLYSKAKIIPWSEYLTLDKSFSIESTVQSEMFVNSMYASLKVKDAIADYFRESLGKRPSVNTEDPDIRVHVYLMGDYCEISLDSSGESLHKRGYRIRQGEAPINEVLAAGMIMLTGWDGATDFLDPMCGSGTLLIEAAMIARGIPAGIYRKSYGFEKWPDFDDELFSEIYNADYERESSIRIFGSDISVQSCAIARANIKNAGLSKTIEVETKDFLDLDPPFENGTILTNPPYGERMRAGSITELYKSVGDVLKQKYAGYTAWIISSSEDGFKNIGLKPSRKIELFNGALPCSFRSFELFRGTYKQKAILRKVNQLPGQPGKSE